MDPPPEGSSTMARPKSRVRVSQTSPLPTTPTPSLTLAPSAISPTPSQGQVAVLGKETVNPHAVVGKISATQTMVVTTTTTTTTSFPPLLLNPPKHLHDMDPKQYPLAASPTPKMIKKLCFDVEGRTTTFEEADDSKRIGSNVSRQLPEPSLYRPSSPRYEPTSPPAVAQMEERGLKTPLPMVSRSSASNTSGLLRTPRIASGTKRPASPVSISEAALRASQEGPRKKRVITRQATERPFTSTGKSSMSRLRSMQTSTPMTPYIGSEETPHDQFTPTLRSRSGREQSSFRREPSNASSTATLEASEEEGEEEEEEEEDVQILSPQSEITRNASFQDHDHTTDGTNHSFADSAARSSWETSGPGIAITPNVDDEADHNTPEMRISDSNLRPRPSALDTAAVQDASLPSPSLSPVTAAANLQSRRTYFDRAGPSRIRARTDRDSIQQDLQHIFTPENPTQTPEDSQSSSLVNTARPENVSEQSESTNASIMRIPEMIDTFEAMPEEMKSYIMYQMLRRCSKPVLHFVADVVNPALKCDFLRQLPVELCLNVIGHLDVQSLCSAARVSKRWRRLIDSAEKVWKHRFDADEYVLQEGELPQAIREGWGWQHASSYTDYEKDLSLAMVKYPERDSSLLTASQTDPGDALVLASPQKFTTNLQNRRTKKKAKSKSKATSRRQLRGTHPLELDDEAILDMSTTTEGPYAAASAAAVAVPHSGIGLPSLINLHLFKSIYMRHHIIRKSWMNNDVAPRHIAFRAHQRHVVTCLQFDADKILTGSDDSNINVYDTQTGALRAKLEGHEGGVWALQYEGNVLVSGSTDRSVRVWDIERAKCNHVFQGHTSTVRCLQILMPTSVGKTADGKDIMMPKQPLIITGSRDSNLRIWKLPKADDPAFFQAGPAPDESTECPYFVRALTGHHHSVRAIAAHADTLVSGSYDTSVRVWKISTGELVHRLIGHSQKVYSVVLDHKRNRCISGSMDYVVRVWSLETGQNLHTLEGHSSLVGLLDLQSDRLVSAAADSTLRIWDPENGQCKSILTAHTGAITCFQHDGQKVISGSDRTLKMWDVSTGEFVKDLLTDLSGVWQVKFNERRCVAAVQRNNLTYIEVLDFGALRHGVSESQRGRRIVVNANGRETSDLSDGSAEAEAVGED